MIFATHMAHALRIAARGLGHVWPNPAVGCVLVKDGRIIGRGWTQPGGRPHAETMALAQAGAQARGATAYVTLEPCAHHGHTPPCADALIAAGVAGVVTALTDPDPRVAGKGHTILRSAGIEVTENVLADQARYVNAGFLKRITRGLPFVTLKLATSLDGRIATAGGESRWITGPDARRAVHAQRLVHDAVLIGAGTARADDPDLTVRDMGAVRQPVRVVMDTHLSHDPTSRLGKTAPRAPVWLLHGTNAHPARRAAWAGQGVSLIEVTTDARGQIGATTALQALAAKGITRVLCEGGGTLAATLLTAGLVDDIAVYAAGLVIGGDGRAAIAPLGLVALAGAPRLKLREAHQIGADSFTLWQVL